MHPEEQNLSYYRTGRFCGDKSFQKDGRRSVYNEELFTQNGVKIKI